jgi:hypothetical protein
LLHVLAFPASTRAIALVLILGFIAASRLPFLDAGYGTNIDAWRVAGAARHIAETGEYQASRFPGNPVHEIACSLFIDGGPRALNALSALFGIAACVALWAIARRLGCRDAALLAVAFSATPVVFVNSVSSKDYVWAVAFVLWALYAALGRRSVVAGVLLGLAIGCRITSGAMLLPLALVLCRSDLKHPPIAVLLRFVAAAGATALVAFTPVWLRYGTGFFTFYNQHGRPDVATILQRGSVEVFGTLGIVGLSLVLVATAISWRRASETSMSVTGNPLLVPALLVWLLLYVVCFAMLPDQAGYLIPLVPAVLLLAARVAPRWALQMAMAALLCAPWVEFSSGKLLPGSIIADRRERLRTIADVERFVAMAEDRLPGANIVVVGAWAPIIAELTPGASLHNRYEYLLTAAQLSELARSGTSVAYASNVIRGFNHRVHGVDLAAYGAQNVRQLLLGQP